MTSQRLNCRGLSRDRTLQEIAEALELNGKTVANHQSSVRQKLAAETAIEFLEKVNALGIA
jgi:DNA-binding CsgD family transcriptional regulator